jgi:hypothetical protein
MEEEPMDPFESSTHSFILKIWLERTAHNVRSVIWRGHITHVPDGERRYVQDVDGIVFFILPYLEEMRASLGWEWRLRRWLHALRARLTRSS